MGKEKSYTPKIPNPNHQSHPFKTADTEQFAYSTFQGHRRHSLKSWHFRNPSTSNLLLISPNRVDVQSTAVGTVLLKDHGRQRLLGNLSHSSWISLVKLELWCNPDKFLTDDSWILVLLGNTTMVQFVDHPQIKKQAWHRVWLVWRHGCADCDILDDFTAWAVLVVSYLSTASCLMKEQQ